ncbi:MAG: 50S ribosomal protein L32 [Verrucomicrobia bacterium]|nr:50S ribosomal protein L32 [Verrucomicrobiota bacterium]
MAVPRNRHSNARKNTKRAHHAKKPKHLSSCSNCREAKPSHVMCPHCGWYAGRQVMAAKD